MSTIKLLKTSPPSLPPSIWSLMARPRFSSMTGPTAMQQPPSALPVCLLRPSAKRAPKSRQDPKDRRAAAPRCVRCGQQLEFSRDFAYSGERKSRRRRRDVTAANRVENQNSNPLVATHSVLLRSYFERGAFYSRHVLYVHRFGLFVRIYKDNFELSQNDSLACSPLLLIPLRYFWAFPSSLKLARQRPILPPRCLSDIRSCMCAWMEATDAGGGRGLFWLM